MGAFTASVLVRDISGDGLPDLVASTWPYDVKTGPGDGRLAIRLGRAGGTFGPLVRYREGLLPRTVASGDFNADGAEDLAATDSQPKASKDLLLYFGRGDGTLRPAVAYPLFSPSWDIVSGDFDANAKLDLAVLTPAGLVILIGNGDGTFVMRDPIELEIAGVLATGDMNGDGAPDLAITDALPPGSVVLFLNDGRAHFRPSGSFPLASPAKNMANPNEIVIVDLNRDKRMDVITYDSDASQLAVLRGDGKGRLSASTTYKVSLGGGLAVGDLNNDQLPDVVSGSSLFLNTGNGLTRLSVGSAGGDTVAVADVNADGYNDLIAVDELIPYGSNYGAPLNIFGARLIVLRQGPLAPPAIVPKLVGSSLKTARAHLRPLGLRATPIMTLHHRGRTGVIEQFPSKGTKILRGASVALTVNAGPRKR
jgi:VCBS repeat protein/PASTA domain-containing protein